ncbi:LOW QUALITY PROTEIN: sperm-associated antigen 16 protein [Brienomyrus brachyistius]|uniref:LOW QUALITY PROTEIN: sperm-associated antigen 16 protein n=1 Tax=Brienomyrus brachyistius TaxID=42636 RepID=UPI0020B3B278|nr:LOW QUALITY PROTEIN: sperm-associated antigen 16 protein [Brienomyrus brachyistius]
MEVPGESDDGAFYFEQVSIPEDSEDGYQYKEVTLDDDCSLTEEDEGLEATVRATREHAEGTGSVDHRIFKDASKVSHIPETVDDFLRNFLVKMRMQRTLQSFQTEWYEMAQHGELRAELADSVPDAYTHNQLLEKQLEDMQRGRDAYRKEFLKATETLTKVQKERDFHCMQHKRVVQEKIRLTEELKKLQEHHASCEAALSLLTHKYQESLKQKVLISLERDKALGRHRNTSTSGTQLQEAKSACGAFQGRHERDASREAEAAAPAGMSNSPTRPTTRSSAGRHSKDSEFPADTRVSPLLSQGRALSAKASGFRLSGTLQAHTLPISGLALHPRESLVATASDEGTWKLLEVPRGRVVASAGGEHGDWLSGCCFHPDGSTLATSGGDAVVRLWDAALGGCVLTLRGHAGAVWGCSFHSCGLFLASCSQDGTARLWDLQSERCRGVLRGHASAVNSVTFLVSSSTLLTASADSTVALWDARTCLRATTFTGHQHPCNHAAFSASGDALGSCDSRGIVKLWDVRTAQAAAVVDLGPHAANQVAFGPSGRELAVAGDDGTIKVVEIGSAQVKSLIGHEGAVHSVVFDHRGEHLLSGGSDGTVRIWE